MSATPPRPALRDLPRLIATVGLIGHLPGPAGTWGSLVAAIAAYGIRDWFGPISLALAALATTVIGIWASGAYAKAQQREDPSEVVIDEVAGQWLTLILAPLNIHFFLLGFVLFRLLDILKPGPIGWAERTLPGGFGIMLDDVIAGLIGLLVIDGVRIWLS